MLYQEDLASCTVNLLAVNSGRLLITLVPGEKKVYKKFINLKQGSNLFAK